MPPGPPARWKVSIGPIEGPAQSGTVDDRVVDLLDGGLSGVDHVQRLAPQGLLEPVRDEAATSWSMVRQTLPALV